MCTSVAQIRRKLALKSSRASSRPGANAALPCVAAAARKESQTTPAKRRTCGGVEVRKTPAYTPDTVSTSVLWLLPYFDIAWYQSTATKCKTL